MQYKTICLQMIQDRPQMYDSLLKNRSLLPTLEQYARQLKASHLDWKETLSQARPGSSDSQINSEALELALNDLLATLPPVFPEDEDEMLSLDAAMAFLLRRRTQTA